jgi:hypothetical protein
MASGNNIKQVSKIELTQRELVIFTIADSGERVAFRSTDKLSITKLQNRTLRIEDKSDTSKNLEFGVDELTEIDAKGIVNTYTALSSKKVRTEKSTFTTKFNNVVTVLYGSVFAGCCPPPEVVDPVATTLEDQDGIVDQVDAPSQIIIDNAQILSYSDVNNVLTILINAGWSAFDIVNGLGGILDTISANPGGDFEIDKVSVNGTPAHRPASTITVVDTDGNTPSITLTETANDLEIEVPAGGATGRIYRRAVWDGQIDTYRDGDVGFHAQAGLYDDNQTGDSIVRLDFSDPDPRGILLDNNVYGNKNRYTTNVGGIADTGLYQWSSDWATNHPTALAYYVVDHYTGYGWVIVPIGAFENWEDAMDNAHGFSYGGFSDYRIPTIQELSTVLNPKEAWYGNGSILQRGNQITGHVGTVANIWCSDTDELVNTDNAYQLRNSRDFSRVAKTYDTLQATIVLRNHF